MFTLAILIGIYSYLILTLGLLGILYNPIVILSSIIYVSITLYCYRRETMVNLLRCFKTFKEIQKSPTSCIKRNLLLSILLSALLFQGIVNLVGALGPELAFDALWYHLTLPKLYLENHSIFFVPGGLLYYSAMPKIAEMLYIASLAINGEILAKLVHFSFGILTCIALFKLSREFFNAKISLLAVVIFYSNLVVGWQSMTAYVDLARTFFEIMALWAFLEWLQKKELKWLIESAVMLGLAISAKLLAIASLFIFSILIIAYFLHKKNKIKDLFIGLSVYWFICLLIPLPWFVFSYINAGNPVYPFFTNIYPVKFNFNLINPLNLSDPISPPYIIFLPIAIIFYRKFKPALKLVALYSFFAIIIWYLTPQTGGGRFILPYLPAFSIVSIVIVTMIRNTKIQYALIGAIIFFAVFSIIYRGGANLKYIPVILGKESKAQFLSNHLNFSFGDFYDTDRFFKKKIKTHDTVLLYGFHNLYYVDFPFIDSSWIKKQDTFNYIAIQNTKLPKRFKMWDIIYYNPKTNVKLYSKGGIRWSY